MVIRRLMERWLGPWSVDLLNFYSYNSLIINILVLAYGVILMAAWFNLGAIRRRLLRNILDGAKQRSHQGDRTVQDRPTSVAEIHWERAVSQARFPFIAEQWSFRLRSASVESVQAVISDEEIISDARKILERTESSDLDL